LRFGVASIFGRFWHLACFKNLKNWCLARHAKILAHSFVLHYSWKWQSLLDVENVLLMLNFGVLAVKQHFAIHKII